MIDFLTFFV